MHHIHGKRGPEGLVVREVYGKGKALGGAS